MKHCCIRFRCVGSWFLELCSLAGMAYILMNWVIIRAFHAESAVKITRCTGLFLVDILHTAHVLQWEVLLGSCYLWDLLMTSKCKTTVMHYETILKMSFKSAIILIYLNSRVQSRCLTTLYIVFLCCVWSAHLALEAKWVWPTYFKLTVSSSLCCAIITHSAQSKPLPSGIWALLFAVRFKSGCVPESASLHRDTVGNLKFPTTRLI